MGLRRIIVTGSPEDASAERNVSIEIQEMLPFVGWITLDTLTDKSELDIESELVAALDALDA